MNPAQRCQDDRHSRYPNVDADSGSTAPARRHAETLGCTNLTVRFASSTASGSAGIDAVNGVSLTVARGTVVGVVGESGSGKTTLARTLVGLQKPTSGVVLCGDINVSDRSHAARRQLGRHIGMVFQDPTSSLNARLSVRAVINDPLYVHRIGTKATRRDVVSRLLDQVGLAAATGDRRVRTLSGGQLQRVAIARALALEPDFVIADEPTSALDVSIQAQILNLLADLRRELRFGMLVISHDMRVMRFISDELVVMLRGVVVEEGAAEQIFAQPQHEYTRRLIRATPLLSTVPGGRKFLDHGEGRWDFGVGAG